MCQLTLGFWLPWVLRLELGLGDCKFRLEARCARLLLGHPGVLSACFLSSCQLFDTEGEFPSTSMSCLATSGCWLWGLR